MTRYTLPVAVWTVALMLTQCLGAQTNTQPEEAAKPAKAKVSSESPRPAAKTAERAASVNMINEMIGQNIVVDAGKSVRITAKSDFGGAERASFGVYADPGVNISKVRIAIWWGMPATSAYAVHDFILGSNFHYTNTGGANVPVAGPSLFLDVLNEGDTPITIQQLTVYAVTRP